MVIERGLCVLQTQKLHLTEELKDIFREMEIVEEEAAEWKRRLDIEREILNMLAIP